MDQQIKEGEVKEILDELAEAQEKIYKCYARLMDLGVVTVTGGKEIPPGTKNNSFNSERRIRMKQGIMVRAVGITKTERKSIVKAVRKIQYGRKKDGRQSLPYVMELK